MSVVRNCSEILKKYINFDSSSFSNSEENADQGRLHVNDNAPFGKESATVSTVYVCPKKECILKTFPWVRLVVPPVFHSSLNVTDAEKVEVA